MLFEWFACDFVGLWIARLCATAKPHSDRLYKGCRIDTAALDFATRAKKEKSYPYADKGIITKNDTDGREDKADFIAFLKKANKHLDKRSRIYYNFLVGISIDCTSARTVGRFVFDLQFNNISRCGSVW